MKQVICGVSAGVAALLCATSASAFQFEGTGTYIDFDDRNDSVLGIEGVYHFNPVDDSGVPLAEAGFLRRSSNVSVGYATFDEADVDILGFQIEAYMQDLYLSAGLARTDFGIAESDDLALELGFLPSDGVRLSVAYENEDLADISTIFLRAKVVKPLAGQSAFNLQAGIGQADDTDDTVVYNVQGDYYVNQAFSLGLEYEDTDQSSSNEEITVRARMFFLPTVSGQIEYTSQDFDDRIAVGVTGRF